MLDPLPTYAELKAEALGWHRRAVDLENLVRQKEIEIIALQERVRILAIENVKLMNKPDANKTRDYDSTDTFYGHEPMQDYL